MDFLLTTLSIKRLLCLILITSLSFFIFLTQHHSEKYWLIWSALFLSLIVNEGSLIHTIKVIALTGLTAMLVVGLSGLLSGTPMLAMVIGLLTIACVMCGQRKPEYFLSGFVINILGIMAGLLTPTITENGQRIIYIGIGTFIVICFQFVMYIGLIKNEFRFNLQVSLRHLQLLSKEIFSTLIQPTYPNNIYLFERRIHVQKIDFLRSLHQLQSVVRYAEKVKYKDPNNLKQLLDKLNLLFDILLDCSLLRFRVKDHATFKVCQVELVEISQAIDKTISHLVKLFGSVKVEERSGELDVTRLAQTIQTLEESYQHVLQVAAQDPLAFFLFICSLKAFVEELEVLALLIVS